MGEETIGASSSRSLGEKNATPTRSKNKIKGKRKNILQGHGEIALWKGRGRYRKGVGEIWIKGRVEKEKKKVLGEKKKKEPFHQPPEKRKARKGGDSLLGGKMLAIDKTKGKKGTGIP